MTPNRRPVVLAAAVATALGLGATALTLPAVAAEAPRAGAPVMDLTDGTLNWGVKESFRRYVNGGGVITTSGGATQAEGNGPFTFANGTGTYNEAGDHGVNVAFDGSVKFAYPAHDFTITVDDLKVVTVGNTGFIKADVTLNDDTQDDIDLATVDLAAATKGDSRTELVYQDIPTTLTADGARAFNGMYKAGDALDPATLSVKAAPATTAPPTGEPTDGPTGEPTDDPSEKPTGQPTGKPTEKPTEEPTGKPTTEPTEKPSPGDSQEPGQVAKGILAWGVKESFRRYIATGGSATVAGGAKDNGDGYDFPYAKADLDADARKLSAAFDGSVRFTYPSHGIDMKFSDVKVEAAGNKGTLSVDVTTPQGTEDDVAFATLDLSGVSYEAKDDVVRLEKVPAAFTADGAAVFANDTTGSMYEEGEAIDPVTLALGLTDDARLPGGSGGSGGNGGSGNGGSGAGGTGGTGSVGSGTAGQTGGTGALASTGAEVNAGALAGAAALVVAAGAGVVVAARRRNAAGDAAG
ncbi:HtaA domain-containing protein [Streptomyces albidoflavus]|uniref:HtaA domain-containing protein n=1 Tax=Streptomyces albidoflavus TaxID=1886 RepID=UPI00308A15D1|nr:HtaA domain-containing protein [Streptomyces albidoflavus]